MRQRLHRASRAGREGQLCARYEREPGARREHQPRARREHQPRAWREHQRGSALLIVFVFAAIIAIMLYSEMPIAVFEAKRQKEQLLIDRGNEYAHAVKLYVRKFGSYPTNMDQLENTNRMRFLRHRFKDPFTGKEDWRVLHAGPGGQLVDSKVKPQGLGNMLGGNSGSASNTGAGNSGSSFGSSSGFGSSSNSSPATATANSGPGSASSGFGSSPSIFGSSGFGQGGAFGSSSGGSQETVVPDLPTRPPAISSNGTPTAASGNGESGGTPVEGGQSPTTSLVPGQSKDAMNELAQSEPTGTQPGGTQPAGTQSAGTEQNAGAPNGAGTNAGAGDGTGTNAGGAAGQNAMDTVRKMLNNPAIGAPLAGSGSTGTSQGMGQTVSGGGIAGVASNAKGHTIKVVNDQTDYSLWEFYYDPTKDATKNLPGAGNGTQPGAGQPGSGFNSGTQPGSSQSIFAQQNSAQSAPASAGGTSAAPSNPQN